MIEVLLRHAGYSWDSSRVWLTAAPDKKAERRATAGPTTSRAATPRVAMQQLPSNLEHDAGTPTEATRAADAARPPEPGVMASTAPETLERLGPRGSGSVARPLEESFFDELVSTSYSIEPHLPWPHTWAQCSLTTAVLGHAQRRQHWRGRDGRRLVRRRQCWIVRVGWRPARRRRCWRGRGGRRLARRRRRRRGRGGRQDQKAQGQQRSRRPSSQGQTSVRHTPHTHTHTHTSILLWVLSDCCRECQSVCES